MIVQSIEVMEFETVLFYIFAVILTLAALRVVTAGNPVHAVLYLVLSFFTGAALWILLKAEFLALILMLVYVGAVMVLFLFVVMMLDIDMMELKRVVRKNMAVATLVGVLIVLEMSAVLFRGFYSPDLHAPEDASRIGLTAEIGKVLFTDYLFNIEIAAIILLVALVAAVTLTIRHRSDAKYTSAGTAVRVRPEERIRIVEMEVESVAAIETAGNGKNGRKQGGSQ